MHGAERDADHQSLAGLPSIEAFDLHGQAASLSVRLGRPGFVSDRLLAGLPSDTLLPVVELCLIGLWERVQHGYVVRDPELLDLLIHAHTHEDDLGGAAMICAVEGHVQNPGSSSCPRCREPVHPPQRDAP
jgi:hypothetical protein